MNKNAFKYIYRYDWLVGEEKNMENTTDVKKPLIVIADDDKLVRTITSDFLKAEEYTVIEVDNGNQVMEIINQQKPDLILLDILMPNKSGIELCHEIRHSNAGEFTPIIMITAFDDDEYVEKVFDAGADDFITKPINTTILKHRAQRLIKAEINRKNLEILAYYDDLTQAYNRKIFVDRFCEEYEKARRKNYTIGIILADIDKFKDINDRYGHVTGDLVLKKLADLLRTNCRQYDLLGRYGGDEFIICLPEVGYKELRQIAERIQRAVNEMKIKTREGVEIKVSGSFGLDIIEPQEVNDIHLVLEQAVNNADKNLYKAKNAGRNTVVG